MFWKKSISPLIHNHNSGWFHPLPILMITVGQLVTHHFVTTRMERKLDEVLSELRGKDLPPHLDSFYIVDARHVFLGVLPLSDY